MDKKIAIAGAVLIVLILGFVIFRPSTGTGASITSNAIKNIALSEEEKYAMFSAEVACQLAEVFQNVDEDTGGDDMKSFVQETIRISEETADKYGYSLSEVTSMQMEYADNVEIQTMARDYAIDMCPEIASELAIDA